MSKTSLIAGIVVLAAAAGGAFAWTQGYLPAGLTGGTTTTAAPDATAAKPKRELTAFEKTLMEPGPLPEMTQGDPAAPIIIVEYASMTCGHCAHFHETTYPVLKKDYIDTGKVYFVMREFPLDPLAAAGFMVARNAPGGRYFDVVDVLFHTQKDWAYASDPVAGLRNISKQFGYSPQTFDQTLSDQKLLDNINVVRTKGADTFKVDATPTFFINGEKVSGAMTPEDLKTRLDKILADTPAS